MLLDAPADVRALDLQGAMRTRAASSTRPRLLRRRRGAGAPRTAARSPTPGWLAWQQGEATARGACPARAIDADPVHAVAPTLALGFVYEDAGRQEEARDTYAEALVLEPGYAEALYRLGRRQRQDGDPAAATATLRQALALSGPETLLLLELSRAALDQQHSDDALRYAREAERLESDNPEVQWNLGLAQLLAGDVLGCVGPLQKAATAGAHGADVGLAVALYRQGKAQAALALRRGHQGLRRPRRPAGAVRGQREAAAIRDNLGKRQWLDRFGRHDAAARLDRARLGRQPQVFLDNGGAHRGAHGAAAARRAPGITRPVDGRTFFECAAQIEPVPGADAHGLSLTYSQVKGAQGSCPRRASRSASTSTGRCASRPWTTSTRRCSPTRLGRAGRARRQPVLGIERLDDVRALRLQRGRPPRRARGGVQVAAELPQPLRPVRLGRGGAWRAGGRLRALRARDPGPVSAPRRAAGFTLLEIMVVIALIGLLLGLVAVAVGRQTEAGRIAECRARIEQFALLLESSKDRNGDYPPDRLAGWRARRQPGERGHRGRRRPCAPPPTAASAPRSAGWPTGTMTTASPSRA